MKDCEKLLLENKFLTNCTLEERCFFRQLEKWLSEHDDSAKRNKKNYWSLNEKLITLVAGNSRLNKVIVTIGRVCSFIAPFIGSAIVFLILNALTIEEAVWRFVAMGTVFVVVNFLIELLWFRQISLKKKLQLRRYGETWVRHTVTEATYEKETLSYICSLGVYNGKTEEEQKKLFMQNILTIFQKNIDKFEENMKSIEEAIE